MNGRAAWLTWKIHRFEVVAAVVLFGVVGVSSWVVASHLNAITVGPECWAQWEGSGDRLTACQQLVERWLDINEHEAGQLTGFLSYLPAIVGAIIGVPVVARELEMRTVSFAWSLQGIRWRWLVARLWPMLAIALIGGALVGITTSELRVAQELSPFEAGTIGDISRQGPVLFSRVVLALGLGLLAGAVVGRTLPAFLVAGILLVAWLVVGAPRVERFAAESHVSYATEEAVSGGEGGYGSVRPLEWLGEAYREPSGRIVDGSLYELACAGANQPGSDCPDNAIDAYADYERMVKIVPQSARSDIERTGTAAGLALGFLAILLTFPVVARRRPG